MARIEVAEGLSLPTTAEDVRLGDELRSTLNTFAIGRVVSIGRAGRTEHRVFVVEGPSGRRDVIIEGDVTVLGMHGIEF